VGVVDQHFRFGMGRTRFVKIVVYELVYPTTAVRGITIGLKP
jgi:hypothetical protein